MKTRAALAVTAGVLAVVILLVLLVVRGGGADRVTPGGQPQAGGPTIVAIHEDVNWYPPCATYPIELGGKQFYPLPMGAPEVDESVYPLKVVAATFGGLGFSVPRVAPPGPGDDVGTVIEYSDGMARFESESGNVAWLTLEVQEYGYVC
jgi:hypothetical protein